MTSEKAIEKKRKYNREYAKKNADKRKEYRKAWRARKLEDNPDYWKEEAAKNKDSQKEYYEKNKVEINKRKKVYTLPPKSLEKVRARDREYAKENADKRKEYKKAWRAKKKAADPDYWKKGVASKESRIAADKKYKKRNQEVLLERGRKYYNINKEEINKKRKEYRKKKYAEDPDYYKKEKIKDGDMKNKARSIASQFPMAESCERCGQRIFLIDITKIIINLKYF